ncbi:hypothetical protein AcW1_000058 [Taiwanofungus camphoratus]|nr:hypothetical protein AcW2_001449 [Antrodia cinnamomea]KAI0962779.1 hypothetical protein AcW1_000058 [Antrodia cinnamomea]
MPPMAFAGLVTKAGFMNKTATVTISRWVVHPKTGKVCNRNIIYCLTVNRTNYSFHVIQRLERSKKFLTHDENNRTFFRDIVHLSLCYPGGSHTVAFRTSRGRHGPYSELPTCLSSQAFQA